MLSLVSSAPLPPRPPFPTYNDPAPSSSSSAPRPPKGWELGVEYDYLIKLRDKWLHEWRWESLSERLSKMDHFLVDYADPIDENETGDGKERYELTLHFVHQRSTREDAIPLLILHGWPGTSSTPRSYSSIHHSFVVGTFFDFHKIIDPLVRVNPPYPCTSPSSPRLVSLPTPPLLTPSHSHTSHPPTHSIVAHPHLSQRPLLTPHLSRNNAPLPFVSLVSSVPTFVRILQRYVPSHLARTLGLADTVPLHHSPRAT